MSAVSGQLSDNGRGAADFDLVAVGVLDEEEARHQRALAVEFLDRVDPVPRRHPRMFGVEIVDGESDMAIAGAELVGLGAAVIDGQLDLERRFGMLK